MNPVMHKPPLFLIPVGPHRHFVDEGFIVYFVLCNSSYYNR